MKKILFAAAVAALSVTASLAGCSLIGSGNGSGNGGNHEEHRHDYYKFVILPTCTEEGYTRYVCDCGDSYDDDYVSAYGHSFTMYKKDGNATCTKDGTKTATCDRQGCNERDTVADEGSKLGHSFTEYKKDNNATCTKDGTKTAACDRQGCNESDTVADAESKLGHSFTLYRKDGNATCTKDGTKTATCDRDGCNETKTVEDGGSKLNHLFTKYVSNGDYTCTKDGTKTAVCDREGCNETDDLPDVGSAAHRYVGGFCTECLQEEYTEGLEFSLSDDGEYYTVKKYGGSEAEVKVPSSYGGVPVKKIGAGAFMENGATSIITKMSLPDGITEIASGAFNGCKLLNEINLPQNITEVPASLFSGCVSLEEVNLPGGVTRIGNWAFAECEKLQSVNIPSGVTQIGESAFYGCKALKSVTIPQSVTAIGKSAFYGTYGLEELNFNAERCADFDIPNNVFSHAGKDGEGVAVNVGDGVSALPKNIFYDTDNAKMNITYYNSGNGVTYVDGDLLYKFVNLKEVVIGSNVKTVMGNAFKNCSALEKVTLGSGLTAINRDAFYLCEALKEVYAAGFDEWCAINFANLYANPVLNTAKLYLDGEEFVGELTIPASLTQIKPYTFLNWKGVTGVTFHDGVTTIGEDAFRGCTGIKSVDIADVAAWCATQISSNPVKFCNRLCLNGTLIRELDIPQGVTSISPLAFADCIYIVKVTLPSGLKTIGDNAFANCYSLAEVENHSSIALGEPRGYGTSREHGGIMYYAYGKCTSSSASKLKSVDGVYIYEASLKDYVVGYNGEAENLLLPASGKGKPYEVNDYAFYNTDITSVVIPDDMTKIGAHAFENCESLISVTMGSGTQEISANAFTGCTALSSLTLSSGLTKIGNEAFKNCTSLTVAAIPDLVREIGEGAFRGCKALGEVTIGRAAYYIGQYAFEGSVITRAVFTEKEGWKAYKSEYYNDEVDVNKPADAAYYLRMSYPDRYWMRST